MTCLHVDARSSSTTLGRLDTIVDDDEAFRIERRTVSRAEQDVGRRRRRSVDASRPSQAAYSLIPA
jgi:hypothetical protein